MGMVLEWVWYWNGYGMGTSEVKSTEIIVNKGGHTHSVSVLPIVLRLSGCGHLCTYTVLRLSGCGHLNLNI